MTGAQPFDLPITSFGIAGLFGKFELELPLTKLPLILVGPNGTGKSTVLSILNLFFTGQWSELSRYPFLSVKLSTGGQCAEFTKDDLIALQALRTFYSRVARPAARIRSLPAEWNEISRILRTRTIPLPPNYDLEQRYYDIRRLSEFVDRITKPSVLFYPTYRRIERELHQLIDLREFAEYDLDLSTGIRQRFLDYGEVIGFGGQDVQGLINQATSDIENSARQALNEHSVRFLELIYQTGKLSTASYRNLISDSTKVDRLIERINTLAPDTINTSLLTESIAGIQDKIRKGGAGRLSAKEDVAIFYVAQLMQVFLRIDALTRPLQQFCHLIDDYLRPFKRAVFDEAHFKVHMRGLDDGDVTLDDFSSGEKQVLSLFAFLMFSVSPRGQILIVDEPELSLSVVWQNRLLADLIGTNRPVIFVTATHSPYIFDKLSLDHTLSMEELLR